MKHGTLMSDNKVVFPVDPKFLDLVEECNFFKVDKMPRMAVCTLELGARNLFCKKFRFGRHTARAVGFFGEVLAK